MKIKQFLKTNLVAIAALLFTVSIMSFKLAESKLADKAADQNFYYISEDMSEGAFHTVGNWTTSEGGSAGCVTSGARPCKVIVPDGSSLSSVLGSKTNAQVLAISIQRKLEP